MEVANTLAYYDTAKITAVKKFYSTGHWSEKNSDFDAVSAAFPSPGCHHEKTLKHLPRKEFIWNGALW